MKLVFNVAHNRDGDGDSTIIIFGDGVKTGMVLLYLAPNRRVAIPSGGRRGLGVRSHFCLPK